MAKNNIKEYIVEKLKIEIDRSKCLSCGSCTAMAPQTFELDDDLICKVKDQGPYDEPELIKEGAQCCPNEAIRVEDLQEAN